MAMNHDTPNTSWPKLYFRIESCKVKGGLSFAEQRQWSNPSFSHIEFRGGGGGGGRGQPKYNGSQQADQTEPSHWASHAGQQQPACPHQQGTARLAGHSRTKSTIDDGAETPALILNKYYCLSVKTVVELNTDLNLLLLRILCKSVHLTVFVWKYSCSV